MQTYKKQKIGNQIHIGESQLLFLDELVYGVIINQLGIHIFTFDIEFSFFRFRIEPVCFLHHSLATNTTLFYVLFHHNAKPSQNGQLYFQTFQFFNLHQFTLAFVQK